MVAPPPSPQVPSRDGSYGAKLPDGSWNGMVGGALHPPPLQIGMMNDDLVDIAVSDFYATAQRAEVVDFSAILDNAE